METPPLVMMVLLLALVFGAMYFAFITGIGGKFPELADWFNSIFNTTTTEAEFETALNSTEALVCAINSVSQGSLYTGGGCSKFYKEGIRRDISETITLGEPKKVDIECSGTPLKCDVNNFVLPQSVSAPEEYIKGFGHPKYLTYYQNLPREAEASWDGHSVWLENADDLLFAWWVGGKTFKLGKTAISVGGKKIANRLGSKIKIAGMEVLDAYKAPAVGFEYFLRQDMKEGAKTIARAKAKEYGQVMRNALTKVDSSDLKLAGKMLALDAVDLFANQLVDNIRLYEPYDDSILLKSPYEDPKPFGMLKENEPIFLSNKGENYPFYMASPCDADLFIEKKVLKCNGYSYDIVTGLSHCNNHDTEDYGTIIPTKEECPHGIEDTSALMSMFPDNNRVPAWLLDGLPGKNKNLYTQTADGFTIRDHVYGAEFVFETKEVEYEYGGKGFKDTDITRISTLIKFTLTKDDGSKVEVDLEKHAGSMRGYLMNDPAESEKSWINFHDYKCEPKGYSIGASPSNKYGDPECKITFGGTGISIFGNDAININEEFRPQCDYCDKLEGYVNNLRNIVFIQSRDPIKSEDEDGNEITVNVNSKNIGLRYDDGKYAINFYDRDDDGVFEAISLDDYKDSGIMWSIGLDKAPKMFLVDNDEDGVLDYVNIDQCRTIGFIIDYERNRGPGENFCALEVSLTRKAVRWAPEAGAGLGTAIGAVGGFFLGWGAGAVPVAGTGFKIGQLSGAAIFTAYLVYEKATGSCAIWPGTEDKC